MWIVGYPLDSGLSQRVLNKKGFPYNITNVEHYDTILGTPFLRKMGIVLDFRSPGIIGIGNEVIPIGKSTL